MTKEDMILELESYLNHILFANDSYIAYKSILACANDYNSEINISSGFFSISQHCIVRCFVLEIAKLYSSSKQEKTLRKLINKVKANQRLFPSETIQDYFDSTGKVISQENYPIDLKSDLSQAEAQLDAYDALVQKFKGRRDKYIAHNDPDFFIETTNVAEKFPINFEEVVSLINFAGDFCNKLLGYIDNRVICIQSTNTNDLQKTMKALATSTSKDI